MIKFSRRWAMPNKNTFNCAPIHEFVQRYINHFKPIVDSFCGENPFVLIHSNDMNPDKPTNHHLDAVEFLKKMKKDHFKLGLFDPPYSLRQCKECYEGMGKKLTHADTLDASFRRVKDELDPLIVEGGIVLSFGWNTVGMGKKKGYEIVEIMLVSHGGHHQDTICTAEYKIHNDLEKERKARAFLAKTVLSEKVLDL